MEAMRPTGYKNLRCDLLEGIIGRRGVDVECTRAKGSILAVGRRFREPYIHL